MRKMEQGTVLKIEREANDQNINRSHNEGRPLAAPSSMVPVASGRCQHFGNSLLQVVLSLQICLKSSKPQQM